MVELMKLSKTFGETKALNELSFAAKPGVAFALLGRNGAGKTTCIRIIMNIFHADSGEVKINGKPVKMHNVKIGYLPEERGLYPKKVILEQMVYLGELRGLKASYAKKKALQLLEQLQATEYMNKRLDTLSKGNQQKIQLAIALINDPDIVILDEPFSGLDPVNAKLLKELVSEQVKLNRTVIFSSHQMSQVEEFCDDICIIDHGECVLSGKLSDIKKSYPRNNIYIEPEMGVSIGLIQNLQKHINVINMSSKGDGFVIHLYKPEQKYELLAVLQKLNIPFDVFSVLEPTLEEIFIERVGQTYETV